jgi:uncharacterized membrane protein HdeD (DUF308 family)
VSGAARLEYHQRVRDSRKEGHMTDAALRLNAISNLREHWGWFLALGIIFILGGIFAIAAPFVAGLTVTIIFSIVLVWLGIMQIIQAFSTKSWSGFIWQLVIGLVVLIGGIAMIINPIVAAITLTLLVGAVFIAKGVMQIMLGLRFRPHSGWGWIVAAGVLAIVVALMILFSWPFSGLWVPGTLVGISLIFSGWSYVMIALAARRTA